MKNAHPVLLLDYCKKNGIKTKYLDYYINHRDKCLKEVNDSLSEYILEGVEDAKQLFLMLLNGGLRGYSFRELDSIVSNFNEELKRIRTEICKKEKKLYNMAKKEKGKDYYNLEGTTINYLLCNLENQVLQYITKYCDKLNIKVGVLVFDGLMIYKKHFKDENELESFINNVEEYIFEKLGINLKIVEKKMDKGIDLSEYDKDYYQELVNQDKENLLLEKKNQEINFSWVKHLVNNLSDLNCAESFKRYNEGEIFYTKSHGWIIFNRNTKLWSFNNDKTTLIYSVSKFFNDKFEEYKKYYEKEYDSEKKENVKFLNLITKTKVKVGMSKFSSGVISQLQNLMMENDNIMAKFDSNPYLIAFKDGKVIDLKNNGKVRDIVKEDYIITNTNYNLPERNQEYIDKYNTILRSLVKSDDDLKSLLSSLSCFICGRNINEIFLVYTGSGRNGKGLLDTGLQSILGNYYRTINITQLTTYEKDGNRANSELASCQYSRCVMTSEPESDRNNKLVVSVIKKWTGNDLITTRDLHKSTFTFQPKFTLSIQVNDIPELSIKDDAIQKRMKIIELPFTFVDKEEEDLLENERIKNPELKRLISTDEYRNAFLYILIDSWIQNNGLFYEGQSVKQYTKDYFESQNPVKFWFDEKYEVDDSIWMSSTDLFNEYRYINSSITHTTFGRLMKEICKCKRTNKGVMYNCKIKEENKRFL